ncbi:MAG: NADAR family protein [Proteobacteria bacterium]|nr:NADAR family protein [Pseudomonadota bacterium]
MLVKHQQDDPDYLKNIFQKEFNGKIVGFNKKNRVEFLSNFYPSTISFENDLYPTVEHAYQSSKTTNQQSRLLIKKAKTPYDAKKLGRSLVLHEKWNDMKIDIMRSLIREKFKNPFLRHLLSLTNDNQLINENKWNDKFWGMTNGVGENWLGKILEEVRKEIIVEDSLDF